MDELGMNSGTLLSWVHQGQSWFSQEARSGHSWDSWPNLAKQTGYTISGDVTFGSEWGSWPGGRL